MSSLKNLLKNLGLVIKLNCFENPNLSMRNASGPKKNPLLIILPFFYFVGP